MENMLAKYLGRPFMEGEGTGGGTPAPAPAPAPVVVDAPAAPAPEGNKDGGTALDRALASAAAADPAKPADPAAPAPAPAPVAWKEYEKDATKSDAENEAAKVEHDKGKPAADGAIDPASYTIDTPEGLEVDDGVMTEFRGLAAENKWDQSVVDKLKGLQTKLYEKAATQMAEQSTAWGNAIMADKELGGPEHDAKMGKAGAFLQEFFDPAAVKLLTDRGLGNEPELIRGFYRAGLAMGEAGTIQNRRPVGETESAADILYGKK